jgi:hypothetical protein
VTDRLFVVRRMFRLNDTLPTETAMTTKWTWERGGWLLVGDGKWHNSRCRV